jgi:cation transport protein ChaC
VGSTINPDHQPGPIALNLTTPHDTENINNALAGMAAKILPDTDLTDGDLWVFGYGSLIWNPGFAFVEQVPARLIGEHRALCIYSWVHRGTPERPGLVLGLDRGGACQGIAFLVAPEHRTATIAYLRAREQVTSVYREVRRSVWLKNHAQARVSAIAYVSDRGHDQYAGRLPLEQQLHLVRQGHGSSGANTDYVLATVQALEARGIHDATLHQLAGRLRGDATVQV